ncbi:MAG TPA: hypothetical protein VFA38_02835 [Nitrospirales bacterium]|nr:hypothetical protein [Nitrospirales bacterium]
MLTTLLLGGVLGAVIVFVWNAISWMLLPWHQWTFSKFKDEETVGRVIAANVDRDGLYLGPCPSKTGEPPKAGPRIFSTIRLGGMEGMGGYLIGSFLIGLLGALFIMGLLLHHTPGNSYAHRVGFVMVVALTGGILSHLPHWNWWGFPASYTAVAIADLVIGWGLAGLAMAALL